MSEPIAITLPAHAMTVQDVARLLGVSVSTVWRDIRLGTLPVVRRGKRCTRVYPTQLAEWFRRNAPTVKVVIQCPAS